MNTACRATVTVGEADGIALEQHNEEVMAEAMAVARRAMAARGEEGHPLGPLRTGEEGA